MNTSSSPLAGMTPQHADAMNAWASAPAADRPALPMAQCLVALASHRDRVTDTLTHESDFSRRAQLIHVCDGIDAACQVIRGVCAS